MNRRSVFARLKWIVAAPLLPLVSAGSTLTSATRVAAPQVKEAVAGAVEAEGTPILVFNDVDQGWWLKVGPNLFRLETYLRYEDYQDVVERWHDILPIQWQQNLVPEALEEAQGIWRTIEPFTRRYVG